MLRGIIDSEKLIKEVKKRPMLYDGRTSDVSVRKILWEEIAKEILPEVWDSSNNMERETLVREIQVKWKGFRDSYNRTRKAEREDQQKGIKKQRKKYIFYEQLSFLESVCRRTQSPSSVNIQEDDQLEGEDSNIDNTFFPSENSNIFKTDQEMYSEEDPINTEYQVVGQTVTADNTLTDILKEIVKIQKDEGADDRMGNKKFLLSLLPFMDKLPDDVNLEVRLQLMSILQTYSGGESFMKA